MPKALKQALKNRRGTAAAEKGAAPMSADVERLLREANARVEKAEREREETIEQTSKRADTLERRVKQLETDAIALDHLRTGLALLGLAAGDGTGTGDVSEAQVRHIVAQALRELPPSGAPVYVPAPEVLRKKYQQQAVDRIMARVGELSVDEREALSFLLAHDIFLTITRVAVALSGNDNGGNRDRWGKALQGLVSAGCVVIGGAGRSGRKSDVRGWVAKELSAHNPSDAEIDDVHRAVLAAISA